MMAPEGPVSSILVTCSDKPRLERTYVPALRLAGWNGELRIVNPEDPFPSLEGVTGLLLCGGYDIHPRHWNPSEPVHPSAELDEGRDALEIPLVKVAWERGLPILGVCRGEQILNVALGGSLIQDVPSHFGCAADVHNHGTAEKPEIWHEVRVEPSSRLSNLLGGTVVPVNSRHHQAVDRLAPGLRPVAWPLSGPALIEGIECEDATRWVFGVQWHPENLVGMENGAGSAARNLFSGFAAAAGKSGSGWRPGDRIRKDGSW